MDKIKVNKLASVDGTCLQSEINIPYHYIVKLFGKHQSQKGGYKTDAEWTLETPFGVGTIYNYKDGKNYLGKKEGLAIRDITEWHIGGKNKETGIIILTALECFKAGYENAYNK